MEQHTLKNKSNCLNTKIYSYLETYGVKVLIYIQMLFTFSTLVLIRHLWQLKTVVFLHRCLIRAVLLLYLLHLIKSSNPTSFSVAWQCFWRDRLLTLNVSKHDITRGTGNLGKNDINQGQASSTGMPPDSKQS
jgi:hypothetical protein